ncbi:MAG: radical SAM protein [Oscillospiraceae bacterium]|nr:radical SAM protein [Oscillospiraceae bacterium]
MIIRAKTKDLFAGRALTAAQCKNSQLNIEELEAGALVLRSLPRRIVLELSNNCNLNCRMCGRKAANFCLSELDMELFYSLEPLFDTVEEVTLMGWGEPTIHPHFEEMLQVLSRHSARIYFCTNGMRLKSLHDAIFDCGVDVFAVSVDGANPVTNSEIRRGSDLEKINAELRKIVQRKKREGLCYPHINYVFCAMKRNLRELPSLVEMAAQVGLDEVKVVFLTAFSEDFVQESLYGEDELVRKVFKETTQRAKELGILLKLPHIQDADPAGDALHRECFAVYRDFYLGSDGYVRPCMSTAHKLFAYDRSRPFMEMWNADEYQEYRRSVNSPEMPQNCRSCYQSSHCNWNRKKSFIQLGENFAPSWGIE